VSPAGARLDAYFEAGGWERVAHAYGYDPDDHTNANT
jgi:hypothetical protein